MTTDEFLKLKKEEQDVILAKMGDIQKIAEDIVKQEMASGLPRLTMKELEDTIKGVMEKLIKGMTPTDKKFFVYPGIGNETVITDDLSPKGKFAKTIMFMKALVNGETQILRAMHEDVRKTKSLSEGTTTAGGFLVPEEFLAEIQRLEPLYGVMRRECRIIPMKFDTLNIPAAGTTRQSANWTNEASQILQTDPNFRQLTLTINKLASIPSVSNELLDDANVDTIQYLAMIIAEEFGKQEDVQGFTGTGSPFVGALEATGVPTTPLASGTAMTMLSYPDVIKASRNIYDNVLDGSKYYFHRSMIGHLQSLITTAGAPIFVPGSNQIAGFPLVSVEALPGTANASAATGTFDFAVFGNIRRGIAMGERGSMTVAISEHATVGSNNLFEKDMRALRVIERVAMGVLLPSAFTRFTT